jgi:hypothetical protein
MDQHFARTTAQVHRALQTSLLVITFLGTVNCLERPYNSALAQSSDTPAPKTELIFDVPSSAPIELPNGFLREDLAVSTPSRISAVKGKLVVEITNLENHNIVGRKDYDGTVDENAVRITMEFKGERSTRFEASYTFTPRDGGRTESTVRRIPYILTPVEARYAKINGPKVVGLGTRAPFLFRVPATGERPMMFSARNLPDGLTLDVATGIISGHLEKAGTYDLDLKATNAYGSADRQLRIIVGGKLALTPPLGWNSWNAFGLTVSQDKVEAITDAFVKTGLVNHGWAYVNTDIGWEPKERNTDGTISGNQKFPDMKALTDYIHAYGLKAGIYISAGTTVCDVDNDETGLGSYGHVESDAKTFADWGFDYLKYDWCSYERVARDHSVPELEKPYGEMKAALLSTHRDFVFSLCQYGMGHVWEWGDSVGGNSWRIVGDITDTWKSISDNGFNHDMAAAFAKPGNWNDPDMLVIGRGRFGAPDLGIHLSRLTPDEQYTHISLWSMLAAPLLIGSDLTQADDFTLNLLSNDEVIDIDQDPLGRQAVAVVKDQDHQVLMKEMEDGSKIVGIFNLEGQDADIEVTWKELGLNGDYQIRDVWRQRDLRDSDSRVDQVVPAHGVALLSLKKKGSVLTKASNF